MTISKKMLGLIVAIAIAVTVIIGNVAYNAGYANGDADGHDKAMDYIALTEGTSHWSIPVNGEYYEVTVMEGWVY